MMWKSCVKAYLQIFLHGIFFDMLRVGMFYYIFAIPRPSKFGTLRLVAGFARIQRKWARLNS